MENCIRCGGEVRLEGFPLGQKCLDGLGERFRELGAKLAELQTRQKFAKRKTPK